MRYLCVNCDHQFESDETTNGKARCPKCMRIHGVERLKGQGAAAAAGNANRVWILSAVLMLFGLAGGWYMWSRRSADVVTGTPPMKPLSRSQLLGFLRRDGIDVRTFGDVFESDAVSDWAGQQVKGGSNVERAKSIAAAIRRASEKRAIQTSTIYHPGDAPLRSGDKIVPLLKKDGAAAAVSSLELALLSVAALREEDVPAMIAEVSRFPGDKSPADPTGLLGYYAVAVPPTDDAPARDVVDVYGGRTTTPAPADVRILTDVQAFGAILNMEAARFVVNESNAANALSYVTDALKLDGQNPNARCIRGLMLAANGAIDDARREFESALQLRAGPAQHNALAGFAIATRDLETATRETDAALKDMPDFASGHATRAQIAMMSGDAEAANAALQKVAALEPTFPLLPLLQANYFMGERELPQAIEYAKKYATSRPRDIQAHLLLASAYKASNRYDDMRRSVQDALRNAPSAQRDRLRELVKQSLGETALEEPAPLGADEEEVAANSAEELEEPGELNLGGSGGLLGSKRGPSLLGGSELGGGPSLGGGPGGLQFPDPSQLQLRDPDSLGSTPRLNQDGLKLNANP